LLNRHCLRGCMHRVARAMSIAQLYHEFARSVVCSHWSTAILDFFQRRGSKVALVLFSLFGTGSLLAGDAFLDAPATGRFILSPPSGKELLRQCSRPTQRCRGILAPFFPRRGRTRNIPFRIPGSAA
jgi:hypothetical protein